MNKDYTNEFILNSLGLPIIKNFDTLANSLGLSKTLIYFLNTNPEKYYKSFDINKRNGTKRTIYSPSYSLKLIQRWILEEILENINISNESMAFKKGPNRGIKKNAEYHKYNLYILEMDMQDFFTSISRERIFYLFRNLGYNYLISNILANLCTYNDCLPQGGVCSPYISNLISYQLDKRIVSLCSKRDILYTRYADDLTFSCNNKTVLKKIRKVIEKIIVDEGFTVNKTKTRFLSPNSHKVITGITVNNQNLKANKSLKRKIRSMIHHSILNCDYSNNDKIRGYISFIDYIENGYKEKIITYINKLTSQKDYGFFNDIVEEFNNNKLFPHLDDMIRIEFDNTDIYAEIDYFTITVEDHYRNSLHKREVFLLKNGYIGNDTIEDIELPF